MKKLLEIINIILLNKDETMLTKLNPSDNLIRLGLDSLDLAELTVRIESEFGIDVFDDGLVFTIDEIIKKLKIDE